MAKGADRFVKRRNKKHALCASSASGIRNSMAGMFTVHQTIGSILCCKCGIPIQPNAANMCVMCFSSEIDITEGLKKLVMIKHCPECDTYLQPPYTRIKAKLESNELKEFCLRILDLKRAGVTLVQAKFIWTEPHSKRIKLKCTIQKEVLNGAVFKKSYSPEFVQQDSMCESCSRIQANPDQWVACVQLRQHVTHRRTFFYLEQLILKHDAAVRAIKIKQVGQGIDFFFGNVSHGKKFVDFLGKVAPVRFSHDKQLVSHDCKSSKWSYKYTFSVQISPICREDLICLPPKVANSLGNLGPLVICTKVTNSIALLDPLTLRHCYLDGSQYWKSCFKSLLTSRQFMEYIVLYVDTPREVDVGSSRYALAEAHVARLSDYGKNNTIFYIKTHLGHILKSGDHALGYDLYGANINDFQLEKYKGLVLPEVILIKKSYREERQRKHGKPRAWKLKSLNMEVDDSRGIKDQEKMDTEYEQFLRDLEENPELRFNISLYRNREYRPSEMASMTDREDVPSIPLEELLADLDISDMEDVDDDITKE